MKPNPISLETAKMLSEKLNVPIEQIMHMPQHILLQKLTEIAKEENAGTKSKE
ncbi:YycC family protein [Aneurinibacillus migulanus]|uniref:YycC-like protein n=1 Tax=Aneurinibacillus migulanus TaxID=47500 RepID=A0A1G8LSV2_ANEMI|nr:YycC family protein [Aneurinibacillus migulanus]MCP1355132.1 YycC family protein [Aneurinibacillus migulanus]MED0893332.1 YycC family protein [Aneurinibacillus migulanus]MED1615363.1 YycC family protein [Aneurinibacillus migulanus]MED4727656.1 YycC family protein [Aneurinibacillus migulanus]SDI58758.1 YycC-like protein [Aneurinibacillus migulanus]